MPLTHLIGAAGVGLVGGLVLLPANWTPICAYLSVALLVGLLLNALEGWWWADPIAALVIAALAACEGVKSWRGESCDCC